MEPLRVVVGTAGHIDHGKTTLVRALTGIDCDRLPEEKARGITIDLGFAHGEWDGIRFGFVDVPGHERFVRNMLAGATGIDLALLVVAADESVKPQTREHLDICRMLGIPAGLVVLTKADRVDAETLDLVRMEVAALVAGSFLEGAPVVAASATTGAGIDEVRRLLAEVARRVGQGGRAEREVLPPRLPVDRAFVVKGFGPVVTGTLVSGRIREGDRLLLLPDGKEIRVRGIQVHGETTTEARAGERTSLNLSGVEIGELHRGQTVAAPGCLAVVRLPTVELTVIAGREKPVADGAPVRFHLGAAEVMGRLRIPGGGAVAPGETALAQVGLEEPIATAAGDRFVLRSATPVETIGGGRVVDPLLRRLGGRIPWIDEARRVLPGGPVGERLAFLATRGGERGIAVDSLPARLGLPPAGVAAVVRDAAGAGGVEEFGGQVVAAEAIARLEARGRSTLDEVAKGDRTRTSIPLPEFAQRVLGRLPAPAREALLARWGATKLFAIERDRVILPGRSEGLAGPESATARAIVEAYEKAGLADPPSPEALSRAFSTKPQIVQGLVRHLVDQGRLVRLPGDWIVARSACDAVAARLRDSGLETIDVAAFKEMFGLTRKLAIPMLEWLDRVDATRREGDRRRILRK